MSENPSPDVQSADEPSRRRLRRHPIHGIFVAIDAPEVAEHPWVVDAIDINAHGLGLVMPPELEAGTEVRLSFKLQEGLEFSRMSAVVQHLEGGSGGVSFSAWPDRERLKLLEFLVDLYEQI